MTHRTLDLANPSVQGALHFAQEHARRIMRSAGRSQPSDGDTRNLKAELARLLWHVPAWDGGFLHGSDAQRREVAERWNIIAQAEPAMLRMGSWPVTEQVAA